MIKRNYISKLSKETIGEIVLSYQNGNTLDDIHKKYKIHIHGIYKILNEHNIKIRSVSESLYKGSKNINKYGYISMLVPINERHLWKTKQYTVTEHRYVMTKHLNRPLESYENIHHINGNRTDNRIENLELWSKKQPYGQRVVDKLKYAEEIIRLYKKDFDDGKIK